MKIKDGFIIRKVAGQYVVVATGEASRNFRGMVKLNETGKTIWNGVAAGKTAEEITEQLVAVSNGDPKTISADVKAMIDSMREAGFLED